jgi:hypothetical protein
MTATLSVDFKSIGHTICKLHPVCGCSVADDNVWVGTQPIHRTLVPVCSWFGQIKMYQLVILVYDSYMCS